MNNYEIVCIDDEPEVVETLKEAISLNGYNFKGFLDPIEAIKYLKSNFKNVILVISDFKMNEFDGLAVKKEINKFCPELPFFVLTAYYDKDMATDAMELGVNKFLEKPFQELPLIMDIENFTENRITLLNDEKEMLEGFIEEATPMLEEIEGLILDLEESPDNDKTLAVYFRLLHTIKGTASSIGLKIMGDYAHKYEDYINALRNKEISFSTVVANVLLQGLDGLKKLFALTKENLCDNGFPLDEEIKIFDILAAKNAYSIGDNEEKSVKFTNQSENLINKTDVIQKESKKEDEKMTVNMKTLDEFMEESGELTVIRNTISKTVKLIESKFTGDDDIQNLNDLLDGMYKVTGNIQSKIVELRKVQLSKTFRPFKRLVRDISKDLNKEVEFTIEGEEIFVDNILAKVFSNTLIHIIRNSLDHGLETKEERTSVGKPVAGKLHIKAQEAGEEILLDVIDDGRGINVEVIKNKALEKGLYSQKELDYMSDKEIINIIFDSGFSTAEAVSDLSGRGVGMDMVRSTIENNGGSLHIESEYGVGSTIKFRVPIPKSVLIVNTLQVKVSDQVFKFQMEDVVEVIRASEENKRSKIDFLNGEPVLRHNESLLPIINLGNTLGLGNGLIDKEIFNIVVLRTGKTQFAVIVDEIEEFEEVVSKKITEQIISSDLYSGASIIGAGEIAMIIDVDGLARKENIKQKSKSRKVNNQRVEDTIGEENQFIVFKDLEKRNYAIPLNSVVRLESINESMTQEGLGRKILNYNGEALSIVNPLDKLNFNENKACVLNDDYTLVVIKGINHQFALAVNEIEDIVSTFQPLDVSTIDTDALSGTFYNDDKITNVVNLKFYEDLVFAYNSNINNTNNLLGTSNVESTMENSSNKSKAA